MSPGENPSAPWWIPREGLPILVFDFSSEKWLGPYVWRGTSTKPLGFRFTGPILCGDFIFDVTLFIARVPSELKNFLAVQNSELVFWSYLTIAWRYHVFDSRFGILVKFCVYRMFYDMFSTFWWITRWKVAFRRKTGFSCRWAKKRTLDRTDPTIEKFMLKSTHHESVTCFFFDPMCATPFNGKCM